MFDPLGALGDLPFEPKVQRYREYARQRQMTLSDLLLENRIIFLAGVINEISGIETVMKMLYLQYENRTQDIHFYISSPGGAVTATLQIYDTMQFLECPVSTYCLGLAASGGAILLAGGTKGKRFALTHSKIMVHQPWGQVGGQVSDIEIQANEILKDRAPPQPDPGQAHRPHHRGDRARDGSRSLLLRSGGEGVRPGG